MLVEAERWSRTSLLLNDIQLWLLSQIYVERASRMLEDEENFILLRDY